jgi:GNAT superfamily N-acetyltransferase
MIRVATLDDIPKLRELKQEVGKDTYFDMGTPEQFESWSADVCGEEYFEKLLNNSTTILVAEYKSELLGMAAISFYEDYSFFSNLYIGLGMQRRGIGSLLTEHRMGMAQNHISLQAPGSTFELRARCFYQNYRAYQHLLKHGFTPYDWKILEHYAFPAVIMKQEIVVPQLERAYS